MTSDFAVYRFLNAAGVLLYVGHTEKGADRFDQHARTKPWWPEVASIAIRYFPTLAEARFEEQSVIDIEQPRHNKVRAFGKTPLQSFRCDLDLWKAAQVKAREEGSNLGAVLRDFLRRYTGRD